MAIAIDTLNLGEAANDASATSIAVNTLATVPAGGFISCQVTWGNSANWLASVSGGSLSWAIDNQQNRGGLGAVGAALVSAQAPAGLASGTTITASFGVNAPVGRSISLTSLTGVDTSSALDTTSGPNSQDSTTAWTSNSTSILAGSILIAVCHCTVTNDTSSGGNGTEAHDFGGGAGTFGCVVKYRIEAVAASYTVDGTWSGSENMMTIAAAYKAAASTDVSRRPMRLMSAWGF